MNLFQFFKKMERPRKVPHFFKFGKYWALTYGEHPYGLNDQQAMLWNAAMHHLAKLNQDIDNAVR